VCVPHRIGAGLPLVVPSLLLSSRSIDGRSVCAFGTASGWDSLRSSHPCYGHGICYTEDRWYAAQFFSHRRGEVSRKMSHTNADGRGAVEIDSQKRTVWPIDELTKETNDAVVAGRLSDLDPDEGTVVIEAVDDAEKTITVDMIRSPIRRFFFEEGPARAYVRLSGVETDVYDRFLRYYGTGTTTGWIEEAVGGGKQFLVPAAGERQGFAIIPQ
jgi:hypothetical protein